MTARSSRLEIRNPLLALPAAAALRTMPESALLAPLLLEMQQDARQRAEKSWQTHKAPMALYWKAVGVYAGHLARVLRRSVSTTTTTDAEAPVEHVYFSAYETRAGWAVYYNPKPEPLGDGRTSYGLRIPILVAHECVSKPDEVVARAVAIFNKHWDEA